MNENPRLTAWPLLFTNRGPILGDGFLAMVRLVGRLLATVDADGVWLNGVNPGALAVGPVNFAEADCALRDVLTRAFVDAASESHSFEEFRAELERFYSEVDPDTAAEWEEARAQLANGRIPLIEGLPREPEGWDPYIRIEQKQATQVTVADNASICEQQHDQVLATAA